MMRFFSVLMICVAYGSEILLMVLTVLLLWDLKKVSPEQLKEDQSYRVRLAGQLRWIGALLVILLLTTIVGASGLDPYGYVHGNPVTLTDPTGGKEEVPGEGGGGSSSGNGGGGGVRMET